MGCFESGGIKMRNLFLVVFCFLSVECFSFTRKSTNIRISEGQIPSAYDYTNNRSRVLQCEASHYFAIWGNMNSDVEFQVHTDTSTNPTVSLGRLSNALAGVYSDHFSIPSNYWVFIKGATGAITNTNDWFTVICGGE
jgi:hypothetical protein